MGRYIDVDKIRIVAQTVDENGDALVSLSDVRRAIEQTPTADVVKVKHGEWMPSYLLEDDRRLYACSSCGYATEAYYQDVRDIKYKFCPNCGAKMKGGA